MISFKPWWLAGWLACMHPFVMLVSVHFLVGSKHQWKCLQFKFALLAYKYLSD
jgi:hypothetical protein